MRQWNILPYACGTSGYLLDRGSAFAFRDAGRGIRKVIYGGFFVELPPGRHEQHPRKRWDPSLTVRLSVPVCPNCSPSCEFAPHLCLGDSYRRVAFGLVGGVKLTHISKELWMLI